MRASRQSAALDGFTSLHLLSGCCLCGCQACYGPRGVAAGKGRGEFELHDGARELWRRHRNTLLKIWRDDEATPGVRGGFSAESLRGYGRYLPAFCEILYDGAKMPKKAPEWPAAVKDMRATIQDNLK